MLNRHLSAFGLPPILGYILGIIAFVGLSIYIFYKTQFAAYIYLFFAISALSLLSETKRNDFLKSCFLEADYTKARLLENSIVALPFLGFLLYQQAWIFALTLFLILFLMEKFQFRNQLNYTIPTPFYHYPFEFLVGFRMTYVLILFAYFLAYMSISVGNFNLGVFALLVIILTSFSFYTQPDSQFYVWIFSNRASTFLLNKILIAIGYLFLLALPILLTVGIFFAEKLALLWIVFSIGAIYLMTIILAKYAAFPKAMNLPETILIIVSIVFPPFLLFLMPFFYRRAIRQLNTVLL